MITSTFGHGVRRVAQASNGGLFAQPARLELTDTEIVLLRACAKSDWSKVQPEIFGVIFEHSLEKEERHEVMPGVFISVKRLPRRS